MPKPPPAALSVQAVWNVFERCGCTEDLSAREVALMKLAFVSGLSAGQECPISLEDRIEFLRDAGLEFSATPPPCTFEPSPN